LLLFSVFVDGTALNVFGDSGPHQRFSAGLLFDSIQVKENGNAEEGQINFRNRALSGSGHGWTAIHVCYGILRQRSLPPHPTVVRIMLSVALVWDVHPVRFVCSRTTGYRPIARFTRHTPVVVLYTSQRPIGIECNEFPIDSRPKGRSYLE
jgi:hypothetical protein